LTLEHLQNKNGEIKHCLKSRVILPVRKAHGHIYAGVLAANGEKHSQESMACATVVSIGRFKGDCADAADRRIGPNEG
jgi:hypothetical protein